jgi:AcrR family transcriptional regulator
LSAAIRIIGERGFRDFTVQELAVRCGVTNGGLLYHVKSKEELFTLVLHEHARRLSEFRRALQPIVQSAEEGCSAAARSTVIDALRRYVQCFVADVDFLRLHATLQWEALEADHPGHLYFRDCARETLTLFAESLSAVSATPLIIARRVEALMHGLLLQWLQAVCEFDLIQEWDAAVEQLLQPKSTV